MSAPTPVIPYFPHRIYKYSVYNDSDVWISKCMLFYTSIHCVSNRFARIQKPLPVLSFPFSSTTTTTPLPWALLIVRSDEKAPLLPSVGPKKIFPFIIDRYYWMEILFEWINLNDRVEKNRTILEDIHTIIRISRLNSILNLFWNTIFWSTFSSSLTFCLYFPNTLCQKLFLPANTVWVESESYL